MLLTTVILRNPTINVFLRLLWNQWAGGASGLLLGGIYAFSVSVAYGAWNDISVLGCVAGAMLIGYIAEAMNKDSYSFRIMIISGLTAGIFGSLVLFLT